jgi:hypothetical protein
MRFEFLAGSMCISGSTVLGGRDGPSETGVRSAAPWVGGTGNEISAPWDDAVRRRRWLEVSLDGCGDLLRLTSMIPVSRTDTSSMSLLVSLLATLTLMSSSYARRPGVTGDGKGEACSVVVGEVTLAVRTGEEGGKRSSGENADGVGM